MDEEQNPVREASNLPPGYRFYPTEEELLCFYLKNKLDNQRDDMKRVIPVVDVYNFDPWQLPPMAGEASVQDSEQWFFFCPRQEREIHGGRPARITPSGYWKATGSSAPVYSSANRAMGMKKTMVFYGGRAPTGSKTKWKMNEYRSFEEDATTKRVQLVQGVHQVRLLAIVRPPTFLTPTSSGAKWRMVEGSLPTLEELEPTAKRRRSPDSSSNNNGSNCCPLGEGIDFKMLEEIEWELMDCV